MNTPIKFALRKITTEEFAILESTFKEEIKPQFSYSFEFKVNNKERLIGVFFKVTFLQNNIPFLVCKVACHFSITEEDWKFFKPEDSSLIVIPKTFMSHIGMITVGSTRGILHTKTEGTRFNRFIVPLINVVDAIKEDVTFDLSQQ